MGGLLAERSVLHGLKDAIGEADQPSVNKMAHKSAENRFATPCPKVSHERFPASG